MQAKTVPHKDRPLRVMFITTSMPIGGAETLLMNLVRGMDQNHFAPEVTCLKKPGPLGEELAGDVPVHSRLLIGKFDFRVLPRLCRLMRTRGIDAVVTVGAGDKMFWGRLAARLAKVPVVMSALHSTGWPDSIGRLNRLLTPLTDAFIGVADAHAQHLIEVEKFPRDKLHTVYNGVDTKRFCPGDFKQMRRKLGIPSAALVVGILAALRPEKNHELFLSGARRILTELPNVHFVVVGDGPRRNTLETQTRSLGIHEVTHFLGSRSDVPQLLRSFDVLALTSHNEASPVSILEALSSGVPVVASDVGSVAESVLPGVTGELISPGDLDGFVEATVKLLRDSQLRFTMGSEGRRRVIEQRSIETMISGYEALIFRLYASNTAQANTTKNLKPFRTAPLSGRG